MSADMKNLQPGNPGPSSTKRSWNRPGRRKSSSKWSDAVRRKEGARRPLFPRWGGRGGELLRPAGNRAHPSCQDWVARKSRAKVVVL